MMMMMTSKKRTREQDSHCQWEKLQEDLVMEILSRLSIKTLINCRVVCKEWLSLICDSKFTRLQSPRSPLHILFVFNNAQEKLKLVEIGSCDSDFHVDDAEFTPQNSLPPCRSFRLMNSCNGLVLLSGGLGNIYVCNPILSEFISIPFSDPCTFLALGFSPRSNEYKVLRIRNIPSGSNEAEIYNISNGTGVWRSIGTTITSGSSYRSKVELHGAVHWIYVHTQYEFNLSCFDFITEQFRQLPLPRCITGPINLRFSPPATLKLAVSRGCLVLFVHPNAPPPAGNFDMWVMKDYGVQESWTKTRVKIASNNLSSCYEPIVFLNAGEFTMIREYNKKRRSLVSYKFKGKRKCFKRRTRFGARPHINTVGLFEAVAYTPSFVSLYDVSKLSTVVKMGGAKKSYSWLLPGCPRCASAGAGMQPKKSLKTNILDSSKITTTSCAVCSGDLGYVFRGKGIPMCQPCYDADSCC